MKKVYQTIVDKEHGNCMQAAVASLFDLELSEVPNFIEHGENWYNVFDDFIRKYGYEPNYISGNVNELHKIARLDNGVNGYFYGAVNSQTFEGITHSVIVDRYLNVVHDPNPNEKALFLKSDDVIGMYTMHPIRIDINGNRYTPKHYDLTHK